VTIFGIVAVSYGVEVTPEAASAILVVINLVMRFITSEPLEA
jgi:hypothetical protein